VERVQKKSRSRDGGGHDPEAITRERGEQTWRVIHSSSKNQYQDIRGLCLALGNIGEEKRDDKIRGGSPAKRVGRESEERTEEQGGLEKEAGPNH